MTINRIKVKKDWFLILLLFILIFFVYRGWFYPGVIGKGDLRTWSPQALKENISPPYAWETNEYGGIYTIVGIKLLRYPINFLHGFYLIF